MPRMWPQPSRHRRRISWWALQERSARRRACHDHCTQNASRNMNTPFVPMVYHVLLLQNCTHLQCPFPGHAALTATVFSCTLPAARAAPVSTYVTGGAPGAAVTTQVTPNAQVPSSSASVQDPQPAAAAGAELDASKQSTRGGPAPSTPARTMHAETTAPVPAGGVTLNPPPMGTRRGAGTFGSGPLSASGVHEV